MASFYESLTPAQKLYSMYFIAKYESSWSWDGHNYTANVNYGDPFTIGIMQDAGSWAYWFLYHLREMYPGAYDAMPATWKNAVNVGPDASLWGGYTMTQSDVDQWSAAVAANLDDMKAFQEYEWCESGWNGISLKSELDDLESWGHLPDNPTLDEIRNVYFYIARYHNTGYNMKRIFDRFGWNGNLNDIRNATIQMYQGYTNFGIYGAGWTNAINDNYDLLTSWDGSTVPDFGQIAGYGSNDGRQNNNTSTENVTYWSTMVKLIKTYGNDLILVDGTGGEHRFVQANANNVWIPYEQTISSGNNSGNSQSSGTASDIIKQVMQYYMDHEGQYTYSLDDSEYDDPPTSGASNCSAYIRFVARTLAPNSEMAQMPYSYTGVMAETGTSIAKGTMNTPFPYDLAQPGDVLLVNWSWDNPDYDHVELFLGTQAQGNFTGSELWGAGSAPLPHKNGYASTYVPNTYNWELRRISWRQTNRNMLMGANRTDDNTANMNGYPDSIMHLQKYLMTQGYYNGKVDGIIDTGYSFTVFALQRFLSDRRYYMGEFDGRLDNPESATIKDLQLWLTDMDLYHGDIDGRIDVHDSLTMRALLEL